MKRFSEQYELLPHAIKNKLRLENDDKVYDAEDVLAISDMCGIPICFDIHHHYCNNPKGTDAKKMVQKAVSSWKETNIPKMHISTGRTGKTDPEHHDYIDEADFRHLLELIGPVDVDIMVEAKKKELAVLPLLGGMENGTR